MIRYPTPHAPDPHLWPRESTLEAFTESVDSAISSFAATSSITSFKLFATIELAHSRSLPCAHGLGTFDNILDRPWSCIVLMLLEWWTGWPWFQHYVVECPPQRGWSETELQPLEYSKIPSICFRLNVHQLRDKVPARFLVSLFVGQELLLCLPQLELYMEEELELRDDIRVAQSPQCSTVRFRRATWAFPVIPSTSHAIHFWDGNR